MSSVFHDIELPGSTPTGSVLDGISPPDSPESIRAQAASLSIEEMRIEDMLSRAAWFPYRPLGPVDRTHQLVLAYDRVMLARAPTLSFTPDGARHKGRTFYLRQAETLAPWIEKVKPGSKLAAKGLKLRLSSRWGLWQRARRLADVRGYQYDDYVQMALDASIKRGWAMMSPNLLSNAKLLGGQDGFESATIPALVAEKYATRIRWCEDSDFQGSAFAGRPEQVAYFRFIAAELVRLYGRSQRAERAFRAYQKDGRIALALDFDSLLS